MVALSSRDDDNDNLGCVQVDIPERHPEEDVEIIDDGIADGFDDKPYKDKSEEDDKSKRPFIFINKEGITVCSMSIEIVPALELAKEGNFSINENSLIIIKDDSARLEDNNINIDESLGRVSDKYPEGNIVYLDSSTDKLSLFSKGIKQAKGNSISVGNIKIFRLPSPLLEPNPLEAMYSNLAHTDIDGKVNIMLMDQNTYPGWERAWSISDKISRKSPSFEDAMTFRKNQQNIDIGVVMDSHRSRVVLYRPSELKRTELHNSSSVYAESSTIPLVFVSDKGASLELKITR